MVKFRFQDLKIWQLAIEIADELFDIADELEKRNYIDLPNSSELPACQCLITLPKVLAHLQKKNLEVF